MRPLTRVTEYLLWTFDDDPPIPAAKKLFVDKIVYRLVRRHHGPQTQLDSRARLLTVLGVLPFRSRAVDL